MVATSFLHGEMYLFWQIFLFNGPGGGKNIYLK